MNHIPKEQPTTCDVVRAPHPTVSTPTLWRLFLAAAAVGLPVSSYLLATEPQPVAPVALSPIPVVTPADGGGVQTVAGRLRERRLERIRARRGKDSDLPTEPPEEPPPVAQQQQQPAQQQYAQQQQQYPQNSPPPQGQYPQGNQGQFNGPQNQFDAQQMQQMKMRQQQQWAQQQQQQQYQDQGGYADEEMASDYGSEEYPQTDWSSDDDWSQDESQSASNNQTQAQQTSGKKRNVFGWLFNKKDVPDQPPVEPNPYRSQGEPGAQNYANNSQGPPTQGYPGGMGQGSGRPNYGEIFDESSPGGSPQNGQQFQQQYAQQPPQFNQQQPQPQQQQPQFNAQQQQLNQQFAEQQQQLNERLALQAELPVLDDTSESAAQVQRKPVKQPTAGGDAFDDAALFGDAPSQPAVNVQQRAAMANQAATREPVTADAFQEAVEAQQMPLEEIATLEPAATPAPEMSLDAEPLPAAETAAADPNPYTGAGLEDDAFTRPLQEVPVDPPYRRGLAAENKPSADLFQAPQIENASNEPEDTSRSRSSEMPVLSDSLPAESSFEERLASRSGQLGFMGFCPVLLRDFRQLADAKPTFHSLYGRKIMYFSSEAAKSAFDADPSKYIPASGGMDVVYLRQTGGEMEGSLQHAVWFKGRLFLFSEIQSMQTFNENPSEYDAQY